MFVVNLMSFKPFLESADRMTNAYFTGWCTCKLSDRSFSKCFEKDL